MARKPSPAQVRARRLFAARYGGKKAKRAAPRRRKAPARRRKSPVARFARTRRYARAARSGGGRLKSPIDGGLAALAARGAATYLSPTYGPGVGMAAVGYFRRNEALTTLGAMSAIGALVDSAAIPGVGALGAGGVL